MLDISIIGIGVVTKGALKRIGHFSNAFPLFSVLIFASHKHPYLVCVFYLRILCRFPFSQQELANSGFTSNEILFPGKRQNRHSNDLGHKHFKEYIAPVF